MDGGLRSETKGVKCNGRSVPMRQVPIHVDDARELLWRANEEGGVGLGHCRRDRGIVWHAGWACPDLADATLSG
jgi:hypothetical protein